MSSLTRDIKWYQEGERDHDFLCHLADHLIDYIAELEAHAEHDEDNIEGLQHALVRANQRYTQAEATVERLKCCGNCEEWNEAGGRCYANSDKVAWTKHYDPCHFWPPRWAERTAS